MSVISLYAVQNECQYGIEFTKPHNVTNIFFSEAVE